MPSPWSPRGREIMQIFECLAVAGCRSRRVMLISADVRNKRQGAGTQIRFDTIRFVLCALAS